MMDADVGDDVHGEDPTVNQLEAPAAELLGTEAAVFYSGQSTFFALMAHCEEGMNILGCMPTYRYEGGGAAVLGSIQPQPLDFEEDGTLNLKAAGAISLIIIIMPGQSSVLKPHGKGAPRLS
jgi:threonine aldolase